METGFLNRTQIHDGIERKFVVYVPREVQWPSPAILFLHGRGESGTDGLRQMIHGVTPAIIRKREEWPFVVVLPQKPEQDDEWFDHRGMLDAILESVEAEFDVDPRRRYLTGLSQGGRGTIRLAKHLAWEFAAAAAVCGWADPVVAAQELVDLPLRLYHGQLDDVIPPTGSTEVADALFAVGGKVELTLYPDLMHNSWQRAYEESGLPAWFLAHRR